MISARLLRFLFFGGTAAAVNIVLMYLLVSVADWNTPRWRNLANVISVEISLLYSYAVYRLFVWKPAADQHYRERLASQVIRYHGSAGAAVLARWLFVFPVLDWLGVNYVINTIFGALLSCFLNFFLSSRFVFRLNDSGNVNSNVVTGE